MNEKITCLNATCAKCLYAVRLKDNFLGAKVYICKVKQRKHETIDAKDCDGFRCSNPNKIFCKDCQRK